MSTSDEELTWHEIEVGAIFTVPGTTADYKTGDWRSQAPTYDSDRCIKCGVCQLYCPEGCIGQNEDGYFVADLYWCKGCGICARECPTGVISMVEETE